MTAKLTETNKTLAHIEGLLEGWGCEWDNINALDNSKKYRLIELFNLINQKWIVETMNSGYPSDKKLLTKLAEL